VRGGRALLTLPHLGVYSLVVVALR
jgi:hypothetical protein